MQTLRGIDLGFEIRRARLAGDTVLVAAAGELDLAAVPELSRALAPPAALPPRRLIVDLSEVTFVDSCALGAIAAEATARRRAGREVALVCAERRTLRVLEITGLVSVLTIHRTLREALEAGKGRDERDG